MKKLQTTHRDGKRDENLRLQHQADKCRGPVNNSAGPKPTFFLFQFLQFRLIRIRNTDFWKVRPLNFCGPVPLNWAVTTEHNPCTQHYRQP